MNTDQIIAMAREAGFVEIVGEFACSVADLQRFALLVAAHERKECAQVAEDSMNRYWPVMPEAAGACHCVATLIDRRGNA